MFEKEYDSYDNIPAEVRHLYKQDGEKWVIMGAGEIKTPQDVLNVQEALRKEREDHKEVKGTLARYRDMANDPEELQQKIDRIAELESAAAGKMDETKLNEMVEARLRTRTAPLERQISTLKDEKEQLEGSVNEYKGKERKRVIHDHIRKAANEAKVRDSAIEDALLIGENVFDVEEGSNRVVTRDGVGITPGMEPSVWLTEMQRSRPHWWPDSNGAGARGGDGGNGGISNPFTSENWNLTEQGRLMNQDRGKAEQMAKAAGTSIGGPKPEK